MPHDEDEPSRARRRSDCPCAFGDRPLLDPHAADLHRRGDERQRVDEDRPGGREHLDERAADRRPGDERGRPRTRSASSSRRGTGRGGRGRRRTAGTRSRTAPGRGRRGGRRRRGGRVSARRGGTRAGSSRARRRGARSATMRSGRLARRWSTQLPTKIETMFGAQTAAVRRPTWPAPASRSEDAISGSASSEMRSPNCDSVWPIQKVRNRPSRQSDGLAPSARSLVIGARSPASRSASAARCGCRAAPSSGSRRTYGASTSSMARSISASSATLRTTRVLARPLSFRQRGGSVGLDVRQPPARQVVGLRGTSAR